MWILRQFLWNSSYHWEPSKEEGQAIRRIRTGSAKKGGWNAAQSLCAAQLKFEWRHLLLCLWLLGWQTQPHPPSSQWTLYQGSLSWMPGHPYFSINGPGNIFRFWSSYSQHSLLLSFGPPSLIRSSPAALHSGGDASFPFQSLFSTVCNLHSVTPLPDNASSFFGINNPCP